MANPPKSDINKLLPRGTKIESLVVKATEDADVKAARLLQVRWSFFVKELAVYLVSFLFLMVMGGYCCYVVARHGVVSQEARAVFPLLTSLFGGVLGVIVGKAGK